MDPVAVVAACALGFVGGFSGGVLGVGGGVVFVPALALLLDQTQVEAEATSLLAVIAVGVVGAWRQRAYGNVRIREGLIVGLLSPLGVAVGVVLANSLSQRALELSFAAVTLFFAWRIGRRALAHV